MTTFYDNFERANGPPGGNWVLNSGAPVIAGGLIQAPANYVMHNTTVTSATKLEASARVYYHYTAPQTHGPIVKITAGAYLGYSCVVYPSGGNHFFALRRGNYSGFVNLASVQLSGPPPPYNDLYIKWDMGHLTATLNGGYTLEADNSLYAGQHYAGLIGEYAYQQVADVRIISDGAGSLSVNPEVIGNYGACVEVTLTAIGTDWTPGTPGSPTFTVNHGTISAQTVNSATSATLTYCPGTYLGTIIFTDPSTGLTVGALVTSDPGLAVPPGLDWPNDGWKGITNNTGTAFPSHLVMTMDTPLDTEPVMTIRQAITWTWMYMRAIVGGLDPEEPGLPTLDLMWKLLTNRNEQGTYAWNPTRDTSLKEDLEYLVNEFASVRGESQHTLQSVLDLLSGDPAKSHVDILDAIGEIGTGGNEDVLDALADLRGDEVSTLKWVQDNVGGIRSIAAYGLPDVKDWLDAARGVDLPTIKTVLNAVDGLSFASQGSVNQAISDVGGVASQVTGVGTAVGAVSDLVTSKVALILEAITAVANAIAALAGGGPPVWPGEEGVELGTPVPLATGLTIMEEMDGVLISIGAVDQYKTWYTYDTRRAYRHIGALAFIADNDAVEQYQVVAFTSGVYTPLHLERAAGVVIRTAAGTTGTATPWTRT